jgi:uncharacterized damage-inducible protein DinB
MNYATIFIPDERVPTAIAPAFQYLIDTYASETNKTASVWSLFTEDDLTWRPHPRSSTVHDILKHQLLSERRFFAEFIGCPEPAAAQILPAEQSVQAFSARLVELGVARLEWLSRQSETDWLETRDFFDARRQRIWIFWRRVLHSAHHRTQLTVYLRLLDRTVPSTYGPTADVTWSGADPTLTVEAAQRPKSQH